MKLRILTALVALLLLTAVGSVYGENAAVLSNFKMIDNGPTWTMMFDLTNTGPAKDAIFFVQVYGIPRVWSEAGPEAFTVTGIGPVAVDLSDGFSNSWIGEESGPNIGYKCGNGNATGYYRIYGQPGAPDPNKFQGTTATFTWTFDPNGTDPSGFVITPDMLKVHFQIIGDNWQNNGKSYTGNVVPEPSSVVSMLGLVSGVGLFFRKRSA